MALVTSELEGPTEELIFAKSLLCAQFYALLTFTMIKTSSPYGTSKGQLDLQCCLQPTEQRQ